MVAKKHGFTRTEIKAGITVMTSLFVFCLFIAVITGIRPPEERRHFYSEFPSIEGLNAGGDVRFGGIKVGKVTAIRPSPEDQSRVRVVWTVPEDIPVNADCVTFVSQVSIASEMHLEVTTGSRDARRLDDGALVPKRPGSPGMFGPLKDIAGSMDQVLCEDGLLGDLRKLIGVKDAKKRNVDAIIPVTSVIAGIDRAVSDSTGLVRELHAMVTDKRENVDEILDKLKDLEDSGKRLLDHVHLVLEENREDIKGTVSQAHQLMSRGSKLAGRMAGELDLVSADLKAILKNGKGLLRASSPGIETVVEDLQRITGQLKRFSLVLAETPEAMILGKNPGGR